MSTKVKGLIKGLKYISQIFDEEKEAEIQIGFPTDVKHVAHIGWDGGPSTQQDNPSWMKEFKGQSAPLGPPTGGEANKENPEIKWVSEDKKSSRKNRCGGGGGDTPELPKSSRRQSSTSDDNPDSPKSSKPRQNRRRQSKDGSDVTKSSELGIVGSEDGNPTPILPKKTRRKKSKESDAIGNASSRRSSRGGGGAASSSAAAVTVEPDNADQCEASSPKSVVKEEK